MKNLILCGIYVALCLTVFAPAAFAQVPSGAEPSRAAAQIAPPQVSALPDIEARITSEGTTAEAPAGAETVTFILREIHIEGASVFDAAALEDVYRGSIGTQITLAEVYGIAARLTARYRNAGYILTQVLVPPQTITGGRVRLRVVEGFADKVTVEAGAGIDPVFLQGYARKIAAEKPLNAKTLERYILLMNDLPGISARAVLSPSPAVAGASDVTVFVERKVYDAFFQIDNRGSRYLGPLQMNAGARLNNMLGFYEGIGVQFASAPDGWPARELDFAALSWTQPAGHAGTQISAGYSVTSTAPGYSLSSLDIEGIARAANIEVMHPFIRSRNENLFATLRFDYLDTERSDNLGLGKTEDRLRVLRLAGTYQFADAVFGLSGLNTLRAELSRGLDILNMKSKDSANPTRARGEPEFFKVTAEISRVQRVSERIDIFVAAQGQKAAHKLLASEEFGVGGAAFGSAYNSSEITGEDGIAARLELRLNAPPATPLQAAQLYGFYDIGKVWDNDNTVVKDRQRSLASAGLGLRAGISENLSATIELALPLTRTVETEGDKDLRVFGVVGVRF